MSEFRIIIGEGFCPKGYEGFERYEGSDRMIMRRLIGLSGFVHLHLHGAWWKTISPEQIYFVLENLCINKRKPLITISQ